MNIQDVAAVGEIIGAVAIVVTLAYPAIQVRCAKIAVACWYRALSCMISARSDSVSATKILSDCMQRTPQR